jgi:RNA-directed DNA polymerase
MKHEEEASESVPPRDKQAEEDLWQRHKAERGVWSEPMLVALERGLKGNKWFSLIDKVWSARTLELAWEKVKSNAGACGVDGITIGRFAKDSQIRLLAVNEQLKRETYQPKPVKRVWIEKPGSAEKRPLGIPTVTDRVVQAAVRMVIEPIFENRFAKHSYGFRPGCGCKDALRRVEELLRAGHTHVVDVDIKGYFDAIPHDRLMAQVRERIADGRVLRLIEGFLKQGVNEGTDWHEAKEEGTPQGGVISPLLANIYLNPLDWQMEQSGFEMVRYADDMVVLCRSQVTRRG